VPYFDGHGQYNQYGTCEFNGAYVGDPLHRFYQMYQEVSNGTSDLFTWVHETAGDSNGNPPPNPFTDQSTNQGALDMGFYNMASGDAPTFDYLARHYSMSDNYHQAVMGGTGANHIMLGTGDAAFYQDAAGNAIAVGTGLRSGCGLGPPPAQIPACTASALGSSLGFWRRSALRGRGAGCGRVVATGSRGGSCVPSPGRGAGCGAGARGTSAGLPGCGTR